MATEHTPTTYSVPETEHVVSVDEAVTALNKFHGEVMDPNHPYNSANHPQKAEYMAAVSRLHEIKCGEVEVQTNAAGEELRNPYPQAVVDAMSEGFEIQRQKQAARVAEATVLRDELVKDFNFEFTTIEPDIPEWKIRGWRMQKSLAQKDYPAVATALRKELLLLQAPPETISLLESAVIMPERHKDRDFANLISDVFDANKRRDARIAASKTHGG